MATVAGVTNGCTYLGSAISGWGLGALAGRCGWLAAQWALLALCVAGCVLSLAVRPVWRRFVNVPKRVQQ